MSQKVPVGGFKWNKNILKFNEDFIKHYDEDSDKGYILEVDIEYLKNINDLHSDLPLLPERMKINAVNLYAIYMIKKNNVAHVRSLKQALNHVFGKTVENVRKH